VFFLAAKSDDEQSAIYQSLLDGGLYRYNL